MCDRHFFSSGASLVSHFGAKMAVQQNLGDPLEPLLQYTEEEWAQHAANIDESALSDHAQKCLKTIRDDTKDKLYINL